MINNFPESRNRKESRQDMLCILKPRTASITALEVHTLAFQSIPSSKLAVLSCNLSRQADQGWCGGSIAYEI